MGSNSISLRQINSLANLVPKAADWPKILSRPPVINSLADLIPGSNYSSRVLLFQFNQIETELATNNPNYYNVMEYLTVNKRFDELERFIDAGLINLNPNQDGDNPLADFIMQVVPMSNASAIDKQTIEQILRIVKNVTNAENANISGLRNTPLAHLRELDDEALAIKLVDILIDGGSIDIQNANASNQGSPYVMAALLNDGAPRFRLAEHLIKRGIAITDRDSKGNTVLHRLHEVEHELREDVAKFALKHGVKASDENNLGVNAVEVAINNHISQNVIKLLDPTGELSRDVHPSLFILFDRGNYQEIKIRFTSDDVDTLGPQGTTLLHKAIKAKNLDLVKFLLENKANPNLCFGGGNYVYQALSEGREDIAHILLDAGASPDLLYLDFLPTGGGQRTVSMSAADKSLRVSPELVEKINKKTYFSSSELKALKTILDALITKYPKSEINTPASQVSIRILERLGVNKDRGSCVFQSELITAFNQIMLDPTSIIAYADFNHLAVNYHGAKDHKDSRLKLFQFGYDFADSRISQMLKQAEIPAAKFIMLHMSRAVSACYYNARSENPQYNSHDIRNDFKQAQITAEASEQHEVAQVIADLMTEFGIPSFE